MNGMIQFSSLCFVSVTCCTFLCGDVITASHSTLQSQQWQFVKIQTKKTEIEECGRIELDLFNDSSATADGKSQHKTTPREESSLKLSGECYSDMNSFLIFPQFSSTLKLVELKSET